MESIGSNVTPKWGLCVRSIMNLLRRGFYPPKYLSLTSVQKKSILIPDSLKYDKVFLLDEEEVKSNNIYLSSHEPKGIPGSPDSTWWIRDKSNLIGYVKYADKKGVVDEIGKHNGYESGIRPAIYVAGSEHIYTNLEEDIQSLLIAKTEDTVMIPTHENALPSTSETAVPTATSVPTPEPTKGPAEVTVRVTKMDVLPEDHNEYRFSPFIEFTFSVTNNTTKSIRGVQGTLDIQDIFGETIMPLGCDFTGQTIPPDGTVTYTDLGIDVNPFIDEHVKIMNTGLSDLKFEYEITKIVYN